MIVAAASNGVIGVDQDLPWRIPGDLRRFKELTMGGVVIMGRATFESIGRPLPGRSNVVLTRQAAYRPEGVTVVGDPQLAVDMALAAGADPVFVIGGAQVYRELLPSTGRIELTVVASAPDGDTFLDALDGSAWECVEHREGEGEPEHAFHTLHRSQAGNGLGCLPDALVERQSAS
jgi:dihydrofolate reductase